MTLQNKTRILSRAGQAVPVVPIVWPQDVSNLKYKTGYRLSWEAEAESISISLMLLSSLRGTRHFATGLARTETGTGSNNFQLLALIAHVRSIWKLLPHLWAECYPTESATKV